MDVVLDEYDNGADPESIVNAYPTLQLVDVYAVIAYYLRHRDEVSAYLREREAAAAELRREIESQQPDRAELRAKLLARRHQQECGAMSRTFSRRSLVHAMPPQIARNTAPPSACGSTSSTPPSCRNNDGPA